LIEDWKPVLKSVIEFCLMAGQVWMNLREVNARAVLSEDGVGVKKPIQRAFPPFCVICVPNGVDPRLPDCIAMNEGCA
jgi:hypothetical protein